ncbi:inositol monophosphatase family protein [Palleronia sp. LCG004]|uniref:inositol monophosphatase family protein n=1 Tax=Palleronia sp. LCG004 TaxID=3079304 RepID=UPI0029436B57|nr:inositol monophosphatase family protein [Palleronia sp. LCG004]WOI56267.1 inositol monophosphatase family protein [Palleronia sp. LCG004]
MPMHSAALLDDLRETALALADAARPETLRYFRQPALAAENKAAGGFDPVTEGDRAAERAMREVLARRRPDDGIMGEEYGNVHGRSGLTWVLDPIDGTRAYISGTPSWGVLVAVRDDDGPIMGLVDQPYTGERFFGGPGEAWLDSPAGRSILATRGTETLDRAILFTTFPEIGTETERHAFEAVRDRVMLTRYGLDCYAYGLLALGQIDLVIEAGLNAYDIQGPMAVVQAAGGVVTDWHGGPAHDGGTVLAAANTAIHRAALEVLVR